VDLSNFERSHQATARDMKGRKQYRYHPRWSYIHPAVLNTYLDGSLLDTIRHRINKEMTESLRELSPEEAAVLAFLQYRMKAEARKKNEKSSSPEKPRNGSLRVLLGQSVRSIRKTRREKLETTR
jgi:DNA topoisomerase IB